MLGAERRKSPMRQLISKEFDQAMQGMSLSSGADLSQFSTEPVTSLTLINQPYYSHFERDAETSEQRLNLDLAQVSEAQINQAEVRPGVSLPPVLRQLYLTQNGGMMQNVFSGDASAPREDDLSPFSGYEELLLLEGICSPKKAIGQYASEDQIEMFPCEADRIIILAQWYRETLFLDCRNDLKVPRVSYCDFGRASNLSR
jgi:hypothetical protein